MATMNVTYVVESGSCLPVAQAISREATVRFTVARIRSNATRSLGFRGWGAGSHWWFMRTSMRAGISFFTPRPRAMALRTMARAGGTEPEALNAALPLPGEFHAVAMTVLAFLENHSAKIIMQPAAKRM